MKAIWWLIQINAVLMVYLFYLANTSVESTRLLILSSASLLVAALLEWLGYKLIHGAEGKEQKQSGQSE